jgi:hypothetical protein
LLVVVPNVVKRNWEREVERWIPHRAASVIHGDGDDLDAFSDVIIINYDILDRHAGWASRFGFAGMVVDEAHFIKNRESQRSMNVQRIATAIRGRHGNPLMIALTGTPLINEVEDFRMIWKYLGWIDDDKPTTALMASLEGLEMTPADSGFFPEARQCVIDMGIVRRRKADVAKDIPARRVADIPVELDDEYGRSIRQSEALLMQRLVERYDRIIAGRGDRAAAFGCAGVSFVARSVSGRPRGGSRLRRLSRRSRLRRQGRREERGSQRHGLVGVHTLRRSTSQRRRDAAPYEGHAGLPADEENRVHGTVAGLCDHALGDVEGAVHEVVTEGLKLAAGECQVEVHGCVVPRCQKGDLEARPGARAERDLGGLAGIT